jgi:hypothetical protein
MTTYEAGPLRALPRNLQQLSGKLAQLAAAAAPNQQHVAARATGNTINTTQMRVKQHWLNSASCTARSAD